MTLDVVPGFISVGSTVDVTLLGEHEARLDVVCRRRFGGKVPDSLAAQIAADVFELNGTRVHVAVMLSPGLR